MKSKIDELIKILGKVFFANKTSEKHLARMEFNFSEKKNPCHSQVRDGPQVL